MYLEKSRSPVRKTDYSLISVKKNDQIVNIDSQAPNKLLYEALIERKILLPDFEEITCIKGESTYGSSRLDFYIESSERKGYIEVKGVTLEDKGTAKFPDAPTLRGVKHIYELIKAKNEGFYAYIIFIIQMNNIKYFMPNDETHKEFGDALRLALKNGVNILAYLCDTGPDFIEVSGEKCEILL